MRRRFGGSGGVPEWLKGTGCKPVGVCLRWFESNPLHQPFAAVSLGYGGNGAFDGADGHCSERPMNVARV